MAIVPSALGPGHGNGRRTRRAIQAPSLRLDPPQEGFSVRLLLVPVSGDAEDDAAQESQYAGNDDEPYYAVGGAVGDAGAAGVVGVVIIGETGEAASVKKNPGRHWKESVLGVGVG